MSSHTRVRATATESDPRWQAVRARDPRADGQFFYSVRTTGVYCRPACGARQARPENVQFYATAADAERAGFRPCLRCRPGELSVSQRHAAAIIEACRAMDCAESMPNLETLARQAGLSPWHFHRVFKSLTGITPHAYAAARRGSRLRDGLARVGGARPVTDAIFEAGFNSGGRAYESVDAVLGMTPTIWRGGGPDVRIRFAVGECSLGSILVARSERGLCAILLGDAPEPLVQDLQDRFPKAQLQPGDAAFDTMVATVIGFVEAPRLGLDLPLDLRGTAFQQRVWQALRGVAPGDVASYAEIARRIGAPAAVRAVAGACAANALAVAIPCHRIVRTGGGLSGYRWGVERKRTLLARERGPTGA